MTKFLPPRQTIKSPWSAVSWTWLFSRRQAWELVLTQMSPHGFLPCFCLLPLFMPTGLIVLKNNIQQCLTAPKASANKRITSCILLHRITPVPCLYFPTFYHETKQMDRRRQRKEVRVRCPWESGPWGTLMGWSTETESVSKAWTETTGQLKRAEKSPCDWRTPRSVKWLLRGNKNSFSGG